mmetsp:Transcript_597/g.1377  ORF Transcript_597/g.1377 Transcript_597/m.1377 type:complete len:106 (+) Transcript_597:1335-1652(+)
MSSALMFRGREGKGCSGGQGRAGQGQTRNPPLLPRPCFPNSGNPFPRGWGTGMNFAKDGSRRRAQGTAAQQSGTETQTETLLGRGEVGSAHLGEEPAWVRPFCGP